MMKTDKKLFSKNILPVNSLNYVPGTFYAGLFVSLATFTLLAGWYVLKK